ncbi:MAG TPA: type III PLP-dependent enzyme [Patescibacteria group bacterium]|nr:type III PLP-dependent enzyme [Candidatus Saccharimonadales bacterium]HSX46506.1 type III PLP-dependent enzyme [Patescibacteria group bacterium]
MTNYKEAIRRLNNKTPFFVFDRKQLEENYHRYLKELPSNTEICYAMKANSEKEVLQTLNSIGSSFEVASKYELALLKPIKVDASKILYGTSVKPVEHIKYFVKYGVSRFAFDSEHELEKLALYAPGSKVYVRALVDDRANSVFHMSEKFGTQLKNAVELMRKAKILGLLPYGISFNVGSQARNKDGWARGIKDVVSILKVLESDGIKVEMINFGGGFPFSYQPADAIPSIEEIGASIRSSVLTVPYPLKFIAEPGRGLVANAFVLVTSVIERSVRSNGEWLYIDAGVYNALFEAMAFQGRTQYKVIPLLEHPNIELQNYILTGPTGDNIDIVNKAIQLPVDLALGEKLVISDVGAYTFTLTTKFNGFPTPRTTQL